MSNSINDAFDHAAKSILCQSQLKPKRPWISIETLHVTADRDQARHEGNYVLEQTLAKKVRASVQHDKSQWLTRLIANGNWNAIKNFERNAHELE